MNRKIHVFLAILFLAGSAFVLKSYNERGSHTIDPVVQKEVLKVLDEYMSTFNDKNARAWQKTYHFPHFRLASGKMSVLEKEGDLDSTVFKRLAAGGWDHSKWDHRNIIQAGPGKVHVDTRFTRYKKDGSTIGQYESLYIVTKENGRWGVKFRSSYAE